MRILISFLLLMTSFVFAQNCRVELVSDKSYKPENWRQDRNSAYTYIECGLRQNVNPYTECVKDFGVKDFGDTYSRTHGIYYENGQLIKNQTELERHSWPLVEKQICDDPIEPKKCDFTFCSGADKQRYKSATWFETGSGCTSQVLTSSNVAGGRRYVQTFSCDNPKNSTDVCLFIPDEPIDCTDDDSNDEETNVSQPDLDIPCFGNVEGCNTTTLPDYIDPGTGVPCWGKDCNNATPPDSVGPDGVPCWGDKCGISPPKDKDSNNGSGSGTGSGNGSGNGTGNGEGSGNGTGDGDGDGEGQGWGDCPSGGCPDNSGLINGKGFAKIPDTFHETKYRDKAIEEALDNYIKESPFDFNKIDTDLGVRGSCPVEWSVPFLHGTSINFGVPCSVFDQLRTFFVFLSYLLSFYIVFRKRS